MISAMDADVERKPIERGMKRVSVQRHRVYDEDWNDLAVVTRERVLKLKPQPPGWCIYLNPAFTVQAPAFSAEFSQEARQCQRAWLRTMNRTVGNKHRRHFAKNAEFMERQLAHSGMLIINGAVVAPHDWTTMERTLKANPVFSNSPERS